jgi:hypothetical protein
MTWLGKVPVGVPDGKPCTPRDQTDIYKPSTYLWHGYSEQSYHVGCTSKVAGIVYGIIDSVCSLSTVEGNFGEFDERQSTICNMRCLCNQHTELSSRVYKQLVLQAPDKSIIQPLAQFDHFKSSLW